MSNVYNMVTRQQETSLTLVVPVRPILGNINVWKFLNMIDSEKGTRWPKDPNAPLSDRMRGSMSLYIRPYVLPCSPRFPSCRIERRIIHVARQWSHVEEESSDRSSEAVLGFSFLLRPNHHRKFLGLARKPQGSANKASGLRTRRGLVLVSFDHMMEVSDMKDPRDSMYAIYAYIDPPKPPQCRHMWHTWSVWG